MGLWWRVVRVLLRDLGGGMRIASDEDPSERERSTTGPSPSLSEGNALPWWVGRKGLQVEVVGRCGCPLGQWISLKQGVPK